MLRAYTEIGIGNPTFVNTEIEYPDDTETRQPGFVKMDKIKSLYLRVWLGKKVFIVSTDDGFCTRQKQRNAFKMLFGIGGYIQQVPSKA